MSVRKYPALFILMTHSLFGHTYITDFQKCIFLLKPVQPGVCRLLEKYAKKSISLILSSTIV